MASTFMVRLARCPLQPTASETSCKSHFLPAYRRLEVSLVARRHPSDNPKTNRCLSAVGWGWIIMTLLGPAAPPTPRASTHHPSNARTAETHPSLPAPDLPTMPCTCGASQPWTGSDGLGLS
jgi:hypothetical protein